MEESIRSYQSDLEMTYFGVLDSMDSYLYRVLRTGTQEVRGRCN